MDSFSAGAGLVLYNSFVGEIVADRLTLPYGPLLSLDRYEHRDAFILN